MKDIDWNSLGFHYTETDYVVRCDYKDGRWSEPLLTTDKNISLPIAATALQYGQEVFEGVKAVRGVDNIVRLFRVEEHAKRMYSSAEALCMQPLPVETFIKCIHLVVEKNSDYIPPCDTEACLYLRPLLIGTSAQLGVGAATTYSFIVFASPIGPYYKGGFGCTTFLLERHIDRAAPLGVGAYKVGGNYAAGFRATEPAHAQGYGCLFTDALTHQYLDEAGAANVFAIRGNEYWTPNSQSILPSVTNKSLMVIAKDMGMEVHCEPIPVEQLNTFDELATCGTASIIAPIGRVIDPDNHRTIIYGDEPGEVCTKLYNRLQDIQHARYTDVHHWLTEI